MQARQRAREYKAVGRWTNEDRTARHAQDHPRFSSANDCPPRRESQRRELVTALCSQPFPNSPGNCCADLGIWRW
jgi:hypothetical protein